MKTTLLLSLFALALSAPALANRAVFESIADEASVGNGSAEIGKYNTSLTKKALQAQGLAELEQEYWENCGPWKTITSRRDAIKAVSEIENMVGETQVVEKLNQLYTNKEIFAVVAAVSSPRVECSLTWVNVYGTDGSKLELRYNVGD